jgi:hypothetical protein
LVGWLVGWFVRSSVLYFVLFFLCLVLSCILSFSSPQTADLKVGAATPPGASHTAIPGKTMDGGGPLISEEYDFSQPGQYTIQLSRFDSETKTWVKSNIITVTVVP